MLERIWKGKCPSRGELWQESDGGSETNKRKFRQECDIGKKTRRRE
jgi:hypothetical protein